MLNSKNFLVSVLTLIALFASYFGVELPNSPETIVDSATGLSFIGIIMSVVLPNFLNTTVKLIQNWKEFGFNFGFLTSPNFATQFSTVVLTLLDGFGVTNTLIITIVVNVANFLYHLIATALTKEKPV